jgi:phosphatidylinositol kinase/protein kinase (PI-3  family)
MHTRAWSCATNTGDHAQVWATHAQVLCIRGFLAARKHADRILLLVEMLGTSGFPCFKAGVKTVYALRRRFALQATEPQVLHSVASSVTAAAVRCVQPLSTSQALQRYMASIS